MIFYQPGQPSLVSFSSIREFLSGVSSEHLELGSSDRGCVDLSHGYGGVDGGGVEGAVTMIGYFVLIKHLRWLMTL